MAACALPYDVPANEYLTLEGRKFSSSRNWAVWAPDYLSRYDPDPLRYYLTAHAPEASDSDFSWQEFLDRNNNELVGTWGNLAHRMLTFAFKNFRRAGARAGRAERRGPRLSCHQVEAAFEPVAADLRGLPLPRWRWPRRWPLAREANRYLDAAAPWKTLKSDRARAATATYVALRAIDSLKMLFAALPALSLAAAARLPGLRRRPVRRRRRPPSYHEGDRAHLGLTYSYGVAGDRWQPSTLQPGQALLPPKPLFVKLEPEIVAQELARLG